MNSKIKSFISIEGCDGSGKSTIIKHLKELIQNDDDLKEIPFYFTKEPDDNCIATKKIKEVLYTKEIDDYSKALLFTANRNEHLNDLNKIANENQKDFVVICDRYIHSSLAYQGGLQNLGIENILKMNLELEKIHGKVLPDLTFFINVKPSNLVKRLKERTEQQDVLDINKLNQIQTLMNSYHQVFKYTPDTKMIPIDGNQQSIEVANDVFKVFKEYVLEKFNQNNLVKENIDKKITTKNKQQNFIRGI